MRSKRTSESEFALAAMTRRASNAEAGTESIAARSTSSSSALLTSLPLTRRWRSARQAASSEAFSSAKEEQEGTGTIGDDESPDAVGSV